MKRVVIVGGGFTGLASAYFLRGGGRVTLLEAAPRLGGVVATERREGFLLEGGPDGFPASAPLLSDLCRKLGLETVPSRSGRKAVWEKGRIRDLSVFGGLLSWRGRLRAALDLVLPPGPGDGDVSLGSFLRRRLGEEALERMAAPVLSGIFLASPGDLSLRSNWPGLFQGGRRPRSLILQGRRLRDFWGPRVTLREGMDGLIRRLRSSMPEVDIRTGTPAERIEPSWRVHVPGGVLEAEAVLLALPAPRAAELVGPFSPDLARALSRIRHVSCSTVSLGYCGEAPGGAASLFLGSSGGEEGPVVLVIPSKKFPWRAPRGHWLVRCFFRGIPEGAVRRSREAVRRLWGREEEPVLERTFHWSEGRPVYEVGHQERVRAIERLLPFGLHVAGSSYRGLSLEECLLDARRAADRILHGLSEGAES